MNFEDTEAWKDRGLCLKVKDKTIFFPKKYEPKKVRMAKMICKLCPVKDECLSYALQDPKIIGIWGGTGDKQRQKMRGRN